MEPDPTPTATLTSATTRSAEEPVEDVVFESFLEEIFARQERLREQRGRIPQQRRRRAWPRPLTDSILPGEGEHLTNGWEADAPADDTLVRQAATVHASWAVAVAQALGRPWRQTDRWTGALVGESGALTNPVILTQPVGEQEAADLVAEISDLIPAEVTYFLLSPWLSPDFSRHRLALLGHPPLMVRFPAPRPAPDAGGVEVREVRDAEALAVAERVLVEGYPMPGTARHRAGAQACSTGPLASGSGTSTASRSRSRQRTRPGARRWWSTSPHCPPRGDAGAGRPSPGPPPWPTRRRRRCCSPATTAARRTSGWATWRSSAGRPGCDRHPSPTPGWPGCRHRRTGRHRSPVAEGTCEQIAARADVSPATFFRYFPTKEEVVLRRRLRPPDRGSDPLSPASGGPTSCCAPWAVECHRTARRFGDGGRAGKDCPDPR